MRVTFLGLTAFTMSAIGTLILWGALSAYLVASFRGLEYAILAFIIGGITIFVLLPFLAVGLIYLLDFLTFRIQARYAWDAAILSVKDARWGRFRQVLNVAVEKELIVARFPENFVMTVATTKHRLNSALFSQRTSTEDSSTSQ